MSRTTCGRQPNHARSPVIQSSHSDGGKRKGLQLRELERRPCFQHNRGGNLVDGPLNILGSAAVGYDDAWSGARVGAINHTPRRVRRRRPHLARVRHQCRHSMFRDGVQVELVKLNRRCWAGPPIQLKRTTGMYSEDLHRQDKRQSVLSRKAGVCRSTGSLRTEAEASTASLSATPPDHRRTTMGLAAAAVTVPPSARTVMDCAFGSAPRGIT